MLWIAAPLERMNDRDMWWVESIIPPPKVLEDSSSFLWFDIRGRPNGFATEIIDRGSLNTLLSSMRNLRGTY